MRKHALSLIITLVTLWLGWSVLIDFVVIPTTFRTIGDFFGAGNLGIQLFTKLNNLELVVSTLLVSLLIWLQVQQRRKNIFLLTIPLVLFGISLLYFAYLTPKIATITQLWQKAAATGMAGAAGIADLQQEHQFYHQLYISIDTAKMILLAALLVYSYRKPGSLA